MVKQQQQKKKQHIPHVDKVISYKGRFRNAHSMRDPVRISHCNPVAVELKALKGKQKAKLKRIQSHERPHKCAIYNENTAASRSQGP